MHKEKYTLHHGFSVFVIENFIKLPKKIYDKAYLTQDAKTERLLLSGKHILSSDFEIYPFIVVDENDKVVSRCLLTYYPDDEKGYVGFYESIDSESASAMLFCGVEKKAIEDGKKSLIGPIDASFWIKYRLKINHFEKLYTGEPYNKEYYLNLWKKAGYAISNYYSSNQGKIPTYYDVDAKCINRYNHVINAGYTFKNPTKESFLDNLEEIYELLIKLYSDFPGFKFVELKQFTELFSSLQLVLNFEMVTLAYKNEKLAGFFINVPNFGNATFGRITLSKIMHILKTKKKPKEYVLLYMGVDEGHFGLGGAFAEMAKRYLQEHSQHYIGALILDGKVTNNYYSTMIYDKYRYALLEKKIDI